MIVDRVLLCLDCLLIVSCRRLFVVGIYVCRLLLFFGARRSCGCVCLVLC